MQRTIVKRSGFTLVELLVVIGIIAILVGVLLPSLAAARRAGMSVKCKASLHQIGDAFKMYSVENRGWWPVVKWHPGAGIPPGAPECVTWQDFLFKYLHKGKDLPIGPFTSDNTGLVETRSDLAQVRYSSPLWGCPAFQGQDYFNPKDDIAHYSTGYGMQYYPAAPFKNFGDAVTTAGKATLAVIDSGTSSTISGRFWKSTDWNRNGANRLIIADANQFWIYTSSAQHFKSNFTCEPFFDTTLSGTFVRLDGARHLGPSGLTMRKVRESKGFNVLFADGHVDMQTPFEAYNSTMGGGLDILAP